MLKFNDKGHDDGVFHRREGTSKEAKSTLGKHVGDASGYNSDENYYKEKSIKIWKDRVVRRDKKLHDMKQRLTWLEARLDKVEYKDNIGSKKSKKRHSRREDSIEADSTDSKKHKTMSSQREGKLKEDFQAWSARQKDGGRNDLIYTPMSPFIPQIVNVKIPKNYFTPEFTIYDGKSDPFFHVRQYKNAMVFWNTNDKILCKVFPSSLGDMGSEWFEKLASSSVHCFDQVARLFTERFRMNRKYPNKIDVLQTMIKGANESLRDYAKRYWETYNSIPDITDDWAILSFKNGLHINDNLRKSIVMDLPKTIEELMNRIEKFACLKDKKIQAKLRRKRLGFQKN